MLFYYLTWFSAKTLFIQEIQFQNTLGCNHPKLQPFFAHKLSVVNIKSQATFLYQLKNCTQRMKKHILNTKIKQNWDVKFFLSIKMFKCIPRPISNGLYTCSLLLHCQCPVNTGKPPLPQSWWNAWTWLRAKVFWSSRNISHLVKYNS